MKFKRETLGIILEPEEISKSTLQLRVSIAQKNRLTQQ